MDSHDSEYFGSPILVVAGLHDAQTPIPGRRREPYDDSVARGGTQLWRASLPLAPDIHHQPFQLASQPYRELSARTPVPEVDTDSHIRKAGPFEASLSDERLEARSSTSPRPPPPSSRSAPPYDDPGFSTGFGQISL